MLEICARQHRSMTSWWRSTTDKCRHLRISETGVQSQGVFSPLRGRLLRTSTQATTLDAFNFIVDATSDSHGNDLSSLSTIVAHGVFPGSEVAIHIQLATYEITSCSSSTSVRTPSKSGITLKLQETYLLNFESSSAPKKCHRTAVNDSNND